MSSDHISSSIAVRASTTLLVRDRPSFQVLMVRRNEKMAFAAGALVFPGGKVDPQDEDGRWQKHADGWHDVSAEQRALRIAAIRETFEETGLLVSLRSGGRECGVETTAMAREAMCAGKLDFLGFAQQAEVILDLSQPVPFANWITPEFMPKRGIDERVRYSGWRVGDVVRRVRTQRLGRVYVKSYFIALAAVFAAWRA